MCVSVDVCGMCMCMCVSVDVCECGCVRYVHVHVCECGCVWYVHVHVCEGTYVHVGVSVHMLCVYSCAPGVWKTTRERLINF